MALKGIKVTKIFKRFKFVKGLGQVIGEKTLFRDNHRQNILDKL